jgi:hypothetical protein
MVFLESIAGGAPATTRPEVDERAARRTLRDQIARLERDLGAAVVAAYPRLPAGTAGVPHAGPRLLGLAELERIRDDLADRLAEVRGQAARQAERQAERRLLIERMLLEPGRYKWVRVSSADIGEPGCKHWHVRPRLGLIGMLAGWWHVKISSGCPLAT